MSSRATIKLVLRKSKKRRDGTIPIYLRITKNRKSRYLTTGVHVKASDWNERTERIRRSHPQHALFNDELERFLAEARKAAIDLRADGRKSSTATAIKHKLEGESHSDLFGFSANYAEEQRLKGRYWEWRKVNVLIRKLRAFAKGGELAFAEIDTRFVERFESYMRKECGNATNTVAKNLQILQRMIVKAAKDGLISAGDNPFLYYKIKTEKTTKDKLTIEEVDALEALELESGSPLRVTRDAFLFSFYCAGIRFGDLCRLKWWNVASGRLEYRMSKTGQQKSLKIVGPALQILNAYRSDAGTEEEFIFPLLDSRRDYSDPIYSRRQISSRNVVVNRNLKKLASMAGISINLSFHISRHSFADYARREGVDLYSISKALGHSSLTITETYLKSFDNDAVDGAMDELFS